MNKIHPSLQTVRTHADRMTYWTAKQAGVNFQRTADSTLRVDVGLPPRTVGAHSAGSTRTITYQSRVSDMQQNGDDSAQVTNVLQEKTCPQENTSLTLRTALAFCSSRINKCFNMLPSHLDIPPGNL